MHYASQWHLHIMFEYYVYWKWLLIRMLHRLLIHSTHLRVSRLVTVVIAALIKDGVEYLFENAANFSARTVIIMICILKSICVLENVCGAIHALFHIHYISVYSVNLSSFISL